MHVLSVARLSLADPSFEPRHDKTNKMAVRPAKTQISLGIRPVWSASSLSARRKLGSLATIERTAKTRIRLGGCTGWFESSLGAHSFCWFCRVAAHFSVSYVCTWPLKTSYMLRLWVTWTRDPRKDPPSFSGSGKDPTSFSGSTC